MLSRELKIGILGGIISSVFVIIFIQPILNIVWSAVLSFGEYIQAGYVDKIYRNAAVGDRNMVGQMTLLLVVVLMLFVSVGFLTSGRGIRNKYGVLTSRALMLLMSLMACTMAVIVLVGFSVASGVMEINASFIQRLTVMAPVISDEEYKEWKAKWAVMNSQNDYHVLVSAMEKRAADLKIELPKLRRP